ncbi:MAG: hypothetical protein ACUVWN_14455, partial [bacterium]
MKVIIVLTCVVLTLYISQNVYAEKHGLQEIGIYHYISDQSPHEQMKFEWLIERYDFRQIESYVSEY